MNAAPSRTIRKKPEKATIFKVSQMPVFINGSKKLIADFTLFETIFRINSGNGTTD